MGSAMAINLQKHLQGQGRALHVHNRTKEKAAPVVRQGAQWADSPAELAATCNVVFSVMANDEALLAVFESYLSGHPKPGSVFVDCSTVYPSTTEELVRKAQQAGVQYVASPVFGRPDAAAAKKLLVVSAGASDAKARVQPYQEAMGRGVLDVGEAPHLANVLKLTGNFYISSFIEVLAEGMTLADKNGLSREHVLAMVNGLFPSPIIAGYAERMAKDQFESTPENPGFSVTGGIKDLGHITRLGRDSQAPLPIAELTLQHLKEQEGGGHGDLDWGALTLSIRKAAGMHAP
ncbi:hypothetical protein WJX72_008799 [[Myrmecia] bisecta]|uniref:6-phosphogluconate dehydrogenase n=1 Tax=[Myrmecia] bisecta TaxID=41462 RepID=A0AAW1QC95_9CHLO